MNLKLLLVLAIMATLMALTATGALAFDAIPENAFNTACAQSAGRAAFCP